MSFSSAFVFPFEGPQKAEREGSHREMKKPPGNRGLLVVWVVV
jgi:hypothetical protein